MFNSFFTSLSNNYNYLMSPYKRAIYGLFYTLSTSFSNYCPSSNLPYMNGSTRVSMFNDYILYPKFISCIVSFVLSCVLSIYLTYLR